MLNILSISNTVFDIAFNMTGLKKEIIDPHTPILEFGIVRNKRNEFNKKLSKKLRRKPFSEISEQDTLRQIVGLCITKKVTEIARKKTLKYISRSIKPEAINLYLLLSSHYLIKDNQRTKLKYEIISAVEKEVSMPGQILVYNNHDFSLCFLIEIIISRILDYYIDGKVPNPNEYIFTSLDNLEYFC